MNKLTARAAFLAACLFAPIQECAAEYLLFYLGGQSNMEGYGFAPELPPGWHGIVDRVMIFQGNQGEEDNNRGGEGIWTSLRSGFGTGFSSDGQTNVNSEHFGPELAFGKRSAELNPDYRIAIVKYSRGGRSLLEGASGYGNWEPDSELGGGFNQYDIALAMLRNTLAVHTITRWRPAATVTT